MEKLTFKITLGGSESPNARVCLNGQEKALCIDIQEDVIEFEAECGENNTLSILLMDKTTKDTTIDKDGNILKNQLLHIKNISIDDIDITNLGHMQSEYTPSDPWYKDNHPDAPVLRNHMDLGWNGEWKIDFYIPFYIWILENI